MVAEANKLLRTFLCWQWPSPWKKHPCLNSPIAFLFYCYFSINPPFCPFWRRIPRISEHVSVRDQKQQANRVLLLRHNLVGTICIPAQFEESLYLKKISRHGSLRTVPRFAPLRTRSARTVRPRNWWWRWCRLAKLTIELKAIEIGVIAVCFCAVETEDTPQRPSDGAGRRVLKLMANVLMGLPRAKSAAMRYVFHFLYGGTGD